MYVTSLYLEDVRIIKHCDIKLSKGVTAFVGDNGQGKTTLLEAIYWASHHKSFRHVNNDDVISKNIDSAKIRLDITDEIRPQDIDITLNRVGRDLVLVNGQKLKRIRDLSGTLRVTIFTPDDLDIVKGSSSLRREVLDDTMFQVSKKYVAAYSDYTKILKQKNALLKEQYFDQELLNVLNEALSISGAQIIKGRFVAMNIMREVLKDSYRTIANDNSEVGVRYISKIFGNDNGENIDCDENLEVDEIQKIFLDKISYYSDIEKRRYHSVIGPHRDDIDLTIDDRQTRTQASQGEQRSMALAVKMATHSVVTQISGDNPVLLLDDVFSELDMGRTHRLIECLPATQTFVTTATQLPSTLKVDETFNVEQGKIVLS